MAFTKAHLYNEFDLKASHYAKAISHPARIGILRQLSKSGVRTVEQLMKMHPLSQPAMSQHIAILRKANLVSFKEKYPYTLYSVNKENMRQMKKQLKSCLLTF